MGDADAAPLLEVGQGRRALGTIAEALGSGQRSQVGCTSPPSGLCLDEVFFSQGELEERVAELASGGA